MKTLWRLYHFHFQDERRERLFLASIGFLVTFGIVRAVTHMIRDGVGPFHNIDNGTLHIHHLVWGILLLLVVGYAQLIVEGSGWFPNLVALTFGIAAALTLDEFALWLNFQDVYWTSQGRQSIDAVVIFAALLSVGTWGYPFLRAIGGQVVRPKPRP